MAKTKRKAAYVITGYNGRDSDGVIGVALTPARAVAYAARYAHELSGYDPEFVALEYRHGQSAGQAVFFTDDPAAIRPLLPDHIVRAKGGLGIFAEIHVTHVV